MTEIDLDSVWTILKVTAIPVILFLVLCRPRRTAIHEAGHYVAARRLGGYAGGITVESGYDEDGDYYGGMADCGSSDPATEAAIYAAGGEAEKIHRGISCQVSGADRDGMRNAAARAGITVRQAKQAAYQTLDTPDAKRAVKVLARELTRNGSLSSDDADRIYRGSQAGTEEKSESSGNGLWYVLIVVCGAVALWIIQQA